MKIQCACGAKFAFDVTPEQTQQPVRFVCPSCGLDSSEYVTNLVRQQFGVMGSAPTIDIAPPPEVALPPGETLASPVAASIPTPVPSAPAPAPVQVRLRRSEPKPVETGETVEDARFCRKHPGVRTTEKCVVCQKPICPKCMELFGYVCSPLCKEKADLKGIEVPVFAGQKSLIERRRWRKIGLIAGSATVLIVLLVGFWCWYSWFGSRPHVAFAVRFEKPAYSGESVLCGEDQIVFLHGDTLARYDWKQDKEIWSAQLVDKKAIEEQVEKTIKSLQAAQQRLDQENPDADPIRIPPRDELQEMGERSAAAMLELHVVGKNVWVSSPGKLVQYDWESGKPGKEIDMENSFRGMIPRGDELLMLDEESGKEIVTHVNLATGLTSKEVVGQPGKSGTDLAGAASDGSTEVGIAQTGGSVPQKAAGAGLPIGTPGYDGNTPIDPRKAEEQRSHLSLPAQIALPAVLAVNRSQERALAEMNGSNRPKSSPARTSPEEEANQFTLIPSRDGYVQFSLRLIEARFVERTAVRAKSGKSALDGAVSVTSTAEVANEILGDMQHDRGGDKVTEDESRYQVTVRRADGKGSSEWTVEVVGRPSLFPLKSVNVVTANKKIIVLDKDNKKLWESPLTYNVIRGAADGDEETTGQGPCVERDNMLYVFDQGVLTAFDLKTGNARWRLPSVGISGLFFDDQGMMYVNSTTAGPDSIKYSRQIDVTTRTSGLILKVDPKTGKTFWSREVRGGINYISGKYIYALESYQAPESDGRRPQIGLETESFVRIRRINPKNGKDLWTHFQLRAPLDVKFNKNRIELVFKKEVQVLKFLSL